ncbi:MINDY deubiquitinase domain-containing protein [Sarocladium implicatum]|nr:MINDY deubiquitinase domain-containing protein [Sarocladium implicatum]
MIPRKSIGSSDSRRSSRSPSRTEVNPWNGGDNTENTWEDVGGYNGAPSASGHPSSHGPSFPPYEGSNDSRADEASGHWTPPQRPAPPLPKIETASSDIPSVLRPGGDRYETNPFLKKRQSPIDAGPPSDAFSKLGLDDASGNPWGPTDDGQSTATNNNPPPPIVLQREESDPWAQPKGPSPQPAGSPALVSLPSEDGSGWDDVPPSITVRPPDAPPKTIMSPVPVDEQNVWDDIGGDVPGKGKEKAVDGDEWNLIDTDSEPGSPQAAPAQADEAPPTPKPEKPTERKKWVPPRQPVNGKTETYQVKNIQWQDLGSGPNMRTSPILVQNENGPCPLVALVNALTLTTPSDIPETALVQTLRCREQVSLSLLLDAVFDELMSPRRTTSDDDLPDVSELYSFLQSLHTGMNVNPRFIPSPSMLEAYQNTSLTHLNAAERKELIPGTFENTAEMGLYATFSIPLIHGWLPSKSEPVYQAFERQAASYEDAQNLFFREEELESRLMDPSGSLSDDEQQLYQDILTIKSFLNVSATQLTHWGIEVIRKSMRPGTFAIFFRNDHFSTLYCHPQTRDLVTLVTDTGYRTHAKVVWESLVDVNGEQTQFLGGDYKPIRSGDLATGNDQQHKKGQDYSNWDPSQSSQSDVGGSNAQGSEHIPDHEQEDRDLALALQLQEEEEERQREDEARRQRETQLSEQFIEQQGRSPGLAGGAGRRASQAAPPQPPRPGMGRGSSTNSGLVPERRSSNSVNTQAASNTPPRSPAPTQQVIRPLIPPRRTGTLPAGEEAPPTYEQAAQDPSYEPPVGHPAHATSSIDSRRTSATGTSPNGTSPVPQTHTVPARAGIHIPVGRMPPRDAAGYPVRGARDRGDCIVM